jgi:hypothetical protein
MDVRGKGSIADLLMNRVAAKVVRMAEVPVTP